MRRTKPFFWLAALLGLASSVHAGTTVTINAATAVRTIPDTLYGQNMSVYDSTFLAANTAYVQAVQAMGITNLRIPGGGYGSAVAWDNIEAGANFGSCAPAAWMISMSEMVAFANAVGPGLRFQPIINYKGIWCPTSGNISQAVTKAADWVRYLNITAGGARRADHWEIGNETFFTGDPSYEANGTVYGQNFVLFYNAMKAVDPTIKVGIQVQFDQPTWSQNALIAVRAQGVTPDFGIAHAYPYWNATHANYYLPATDTDLLGANVDLAATFTSQLNTIVANAGYSAGSIPFWMTEYRSSVPEEKATHWSDTMWTAQFLMEMGRLGWQGANIWSLKNGYSTTYESDYGLLRGGSANPDDTPNYSPRPAWYLFPYFSRVFGRNLVSCSDSGSSLRAWASTDAAGDLTIFAANNNETTADNLTVNLSGFTPAPGPNQGRVWLMQVTGTTRTGAYTPNLQRRWIQINGVNNPAVNQMPPAAGVVGTGVTYTVGASFTYNLPAASMVLIKVPRNAGPSPTNTPYAGTPTFTPSPTASPTPICSTLINNMETLTENGTWAGAAAVRSIVPTGSAPLGAVTLGSNCLRVNLTGAAGTWSGDLANLSAFAPNVLQVYPQVRMSVYADPPAFITGSAYNSLELWADCGTCGGGGKWFRKIANGVNVAAGAQELTWAVDFTIDAAANTANPLLATDPLSRLILVYNRGTNTTGSLYLDNLRFSGGCVVTTPTHTPTVTVTPYVGPTCVTTINGMESMAENGTWVGANAVQVTVAAGTAPVGAITQGSMALRVSITADVAWNAGIANLTGFFPGYLQGQDQVLMDVYADTSVTAGQAWHGLDLIADCATCVPPKYSQPIAAGLNINPGANPLTWTLNFSLGTVLATDPISAIGVAYNHQTPTARGSLYLDNLRFKRLGVCLTATPTFTRSPTPSATRTASPTASPSASPTRTASTTATRSATPSSTATPSASPSSTPATTSTFTASRTATPSSSATSTPAATFSSTATHTATGTPSPSATRTASPTGTTTASATATRSSTPTASPSSSITGTNTPGSSPTYSVTPSSTATGTSTRTATATFSATPTASSTVTRSATPSVTPSSSITGTNTPGSSPTYSVTPSSSPTGTMTATGTPTRTATATFSATPTASSTVTRSATPSLTPSSSITGTNTPGSSPTYSATPSSSATGTSTRTATPSLSVTPTTSFTATPSTSPSGTPSATPSWSASASPSITLSITPGSSPTYTATALPSATSTQTPTASPTASSTASASGTATNSPSPTRTASPSASPTGTMTRTNTPGSSPTYSVTPSSSATGTTTSSATPTASPTATATSSATPGASSTSTAPPTPSSSATPSTTALPPPASFTATATPSASSTPTATPTATPSVTPDPTASGAGQGTASLAPAQVTGGAYATLTLTYFAGATAFNNGTLTLALPATWPAPSLVPGAPGYVSVGPGGSATGVSGQIVTISVPTLAPGAPLSIVLGSTAGGGPGLAVPAGAGNAILVVASDPTGSAPLPLASQPSVLIKAPTATPGADGPNQVVEARPDANPNPSVLWVKLAGPADAVRLEVFSKAMIKVRREEGPGCSGAGWVKLPLGSSLGSLPGGFYVLKVSSLRGGHASQAVLVKVLISR